MKVDNKTWESKLNNLHTRSKGITSEHQIDYKNLLKKVFIGNNVLDVGCGTCWLKNYLPKETEYFGLDAFKRDEHKDLNVGIKSIEDFRFLYPKHETLFVFAALDGMKDLERAFENMKKLAAKNIVILTGINISPDLYHTHLITEHFIDEQMFGWKKTVRFQVHPNIIFLEFTK